MPYQFYLSEDEHIVFSTLLSDDFIERQKMFFKRIAEIQEKHNDYFSTRRTLYKFQQHDMLENHFLYFLGNFKANLRWLEASDLTVEIRKEVEEALEDAFRAMP